MVLKTEIIEKADIGVVGLAVMGRKLAKSIEYKWFIVALFGKTISVMESFIEGEGREGKLVGELKVLLLITEWVCECFLSAKESWEL